MMLKNTPYARYIKERKGLEILEDDFGFLTYKFVRKECFIENAHVDVEFRKQGRLHNLINQLTEMALSAGCTYLSASIYLEDEGASASQLAALHMGFKTLRANNDALFMVKEIGGANG